MSSIIYAKRIRCDVCGAETETDPPEFNPLRPSVTPEGWVNLGSNQFTGQDGAPIIRDLCPMCALKPLAEIMVIARADPVEQQSS